MVNQNQNLRIKITGVIFTALNLAIISLGLNSCTPEVKNPLNSTEEQKEQYKNQPSQNPEQIKQNERDDDEEDDKKDDKDNDQDDGKDDKD